MQMLQFHTPAATTILPLLGRALGQDENADFATIFAAVQKIRKKPSRLRNRKAGPDAQVNAVLDALSSLVEQDEE